MTTKPMSSWSEIESDPEFKLLSPASQEMLKQQYLKAAGGPAKALPKPAAKASPLAAYLPPVPKHAPAYSAPKKQSAGEIVKEHGAAGFEQTLTGAIANKTVRDAKAAMSPKAKGIAQQLAESQARRIDYDALLAPQPTMRQQVDAIKQGAADTLTGLNQNLSTGSEGAGEGALAMGSNMVGQLADPAGAALDVLGVQGAAKLIAKGVPAKVARPAAALASGASQGAATSIAQGDPGSVASNTLLSAAVAALSAGHAKAAKAPTLKAHPAARLAAPDVVPSPGRVISPPAPVIEHLAGDVPAALHVPPPLEAHPRTESPPITPEAPATPGGGSALEPWQLTRKEFDAGAVQRFDEPGAGPATTDKPHGLYTTPAEHESPHADLGGDPAYFLKGATNPLDVGDLAFEKVTHARFGRRVSGQPSAGIAALKALTPPDEFNALMTMPKDELSAHLSKAEPDVAWGRYHDAYEMLEGYAGTLARKAGHDAITSKDSVLPGFSEYVALTPDAAKPTAPHRAIVERAVAEGKPVPPEVLADYPDLAKAPSTAPAPHADPLLHLVTSEAGEFSPAVLGHHASRAITFLRDTFRRLVAGEPVDPQAIDRGALAATQAEMRGHAPEEIQAVAAERAQAIRQAAEAHRAPEAAPATPHAAEAGTPAPEPAPRVLTDADLVRQAPNRRTDPDMVVASRYFNFSKAGDLHPDEQATLARLVRETVAEMPSDPKERTTFDDLRSEAAAIDPALLEFIRKPGEGETLHPAVRLAMRNRVNAIKREITALERHAQEARGRASTGEDLAQLARIEGTVEVLERDAKRYLDMLIPTRSQDGRNLAFHRIMAENSFDAEYWTARAARLAGQPLTEHQTSQMLRILSRGDEAMSRLTETLAELERRGIAGHGIGPDGSVGGYIPTALNDDGPVARLWATLRDLHTDETGALDIEGALRRLEGWLMKPESGSATDYQRAFAPHPDPEVMHLLMAGRVAAAEVRGARIELTQMLGKLERTPIPVVASSFRKVGLLVNPGTALINTVGGAVEAVSDSIAKVPAAFADPIVGAVFGRAAKAGKVRASGTISLHPSVFARAFARGATKGLKDAAQVMRFGLTSDQLAKMEIPKEINSGIPLVDLYLNLGFRTTSAPDRVWFNASLEGSIREAAQVFAAHEKRSNRRLNTQRRAEEIYSAVVNPAGPHGSSISAELRTLIATQALDDASYATFQNPTIIGGILSGATSGLKRNPATAAAKPAVDFAYDQIVTFKGIPGALAQRALDYSGVGLGVRALFHTFNGDLGRALREGLSHGEQKAIAMYFGRGATGLGLMTLGLAWGQAGYVEGAYDKSTRDANEAAGRLPSSVKIKFPWMDKARFVPIGQLGQAGVMIIVGSMLRDAVADPGKAGWAVLRTVADSPMTQGIKTAADAWGDEDGAARFVSGLAGSWVPSIVGQTAKALDPSGQEVAIRKDHAMEDGIQARIPGLRNEMPRKRDVLGEPVEAPTGLNAYWRFFGRGSKEDDPVVQELLRHNPEIPKPPDVLKARRRELPLTPELKDEYRKRVGERMRRNIEQVLRDPDYTGDPDANSQKEKLKAALGDARQVTKINMIREYQDTAKRAERHRRPRFRSEQR